MKSITLYLSLLPLFIIMVACTPAAKSYNFHYDINNSDREKFVNRVLLFPTQIIVREVFPGGVIEDMPSWSKMAKQIFVKELGQYLATRMGLHTIVFQSDNISAVIRDHTALLKLINRSIRKHTRGWGSWPQKIDRFDYEIGPGLSYLTKQNVDSALFVTGRQTIEIATTDETVVDIYRYSKDQLTFGRIYLNVSLIDLRSGFILWNNIDHFDGVDIRQANEVKPMLSHFFDTFPVSLYNN
ncbi:MAG: hypothetical protein ACC707_05120 [Thiohalomonadales bacterium]